MVYSLDIGGTVYVLQLSNIYTFVKADSGIL